MSRPQEVPRNFNISDPDMVQTSGVYKTLFEEDAQKFIDFDPAFAPPFAANWQAAIGAAGAVNQDTTLVDQLTGLTANVESKHSVAKSHYQKMKYFIEKGFPDDIAIQNEFGFNDYDDARRKPQRMVNFLGSLHTAAVKYSPQLIAAGYAQSKINEILVIKAELESAIHDHDVFKKTRMHETQTRINILNECWSFAQKVCKAGKIIFENDYAKYNRYILSDEDTTPQPETPPENTQANTPAGS